jgi:hypothetical protein
MTRVCGRQASEKRAHGDKVAQLSDLRHLAFAAEGRDRRQGLGRFNAKPLTDLADGQAGFSAGQWQEPADAGELPVAGLQAAATRVRAGGHQQRDEDQPAAPQLLSGDLQDPLLNYVAGDANEGGCVAMSGGVCSD